MKYNEKQLEQLIMDTVWKVTHIKIPSSDISLLDTRLDINPADFLYIFDILEKKVNKPTALILENHKYTVMNVHALAKALLDLPER